MNRTLVAAACLGLLTLGTTGCNGNYTISFHAADIINAPGNDLTREELEVDVVVLTPKEADRYPQLLDGTVRSAAWFTARDQNSAEFAAIPADQIHALRRGNPNNSRDRLVGPPLLSLVDRSDQRPVEVEVDHPNPGNDNAAIVIFGRFRDMNAMAKTPPVIIQPPPGWGKDKELEIAVDRQGMRCRNCP